MEVGHRNQAGGAGEGGSGGAGGWGVEGAGGGGAGGSGPGSGGEYSRDIGGSRCSCEGCNCPEDSIGVGDE